MLARADAGKLLSGEPSALADGWQVVPFIWDAVRFEVDKRRKFASYCGLVPFT